MFGDTSANAPTRELFRQCIVSVFLLLLALPGPPEALAQGRGEVPVLFRSVVPRYGLQELSFKLPDGPLNPYEPADLEVEALVVTPSGRRLHVPAFYWEEWDAALNQAEARQGWRVRFTPPESGPYEVTVYVSTRRAPFQKQAELSFECIPSSLSGPVRRRKNRLATPGGREFFAYGANLCWGDVRDFERYLGLMRKAADSGVNCLRVWLAPWWLSIEPSPGKYDQRACARLDRIFQEAESLGLRIILCIEQHGNFQPEGDTVGLWRQHPYNVLHGGPCEGPADFFTDEKARNLFKKRLRYLVARWSYSTSLLAWELFNEIELVPLEDGFVAHQERLAQWHIEMAGFLRECDPFAHLVSTSSDIPLQRDLAKEGIIDMIQLHLYDPEDIARKIQDITSAVAEEADVPVLVGEYGETASVSAEGVSRGLFAAALAGASGALPWLQDTPDPTPLLVRLKVARELLEPARVWETTFRRVNAAITPENDLRSLAVSSWDRGYAYVYRLPSAADPEASGSSALLRMPDILPGRYVAEIVSVRNGAQRSTTSVESEAAEEQTAEATVPFPLAEGDLWIRLAPAPIGEPLQ